MGLVSSDELAHPSEWGRPPTLEVTVMSKCYVIDPRPDPKGETPLTCTDNVDYSDLLHLTAALNAYLSRFPLPSVAV